MFSLLVSAAAIIVSGKQFRYSRTQTNTSTAVIVVPTLSAAVSCSAADDLAKNFVVTIDNDTPAKGAKVTTTFDFDLDVPITGGTVYYSATLNGLGPYTSQAALCDETAKSGDPCPLGIGHHHQVSVADSTITGKIVTTIYWYDDAGIEILCAKLTTKSS